MQFILRLTCVLSAACSLAVSSLAVLPMGCGTDDEEAPGPECDQLAPSACATTPGCQVLTAQPAPSGCPGHSSISPTAFACVPAETTCGGAITCAQAPAGDGLWVFGSTCLPQGFVTQAYEACCADPEPVACETLERAECETRDDCSPYLALTYLGSPTDSNPEMLCEASSEPAYFAGCGPADRNCDTAITCAILPATGLRLQFPDSCLPGGWRALSQDACCFGDPPASWMVCEEDADCALLSLGCCDYCHEGWIVAVNQTRAGAAQTALKATECSEPCPGAPCPTLYPECKQSLCGVTENPPQMPCSALNETQCKGAAHCQPLMGAEPAPWCAAETPSEQLFTGCIGAEERCPAVETCARQSSTDEPLVFSNGCIPEGWQTLPWSACCTPAIPEEWVACESSPECVAVEMGCCDHCNGGWLLAVQPAFAAQAKRQFGEGECGDVMCTEIACWPASAYCGEDNKCVALPSTPPEPCAELSTTACAERRDCVVIFGQPAAELCAGLPTAAQPYGCMDALQGCGDFPTCGLDPVTGAEAQFSDTCIPAGWEPVFEGCCPAPQLCQEGEETEIGKLCVRGTMGPTGETIDSDNPPSFQVTPKGCFSSSCTNVHKAECAAAAPQSGVVVVEGLFCLSATGDDICTPDCSGGGFANCAVPAIEVGNYTAKLGTLEVQFVVPSQLPFGGTCVGEQF